VSRSPVPRRFLVAVDHSEPSRAALDIAIGLARGVHATVTLLAVAPLAVGATAEIPLEPDLIMSGQRELDRRAEQLLEELSARIDHDLQVRTVLSWEPAGPAIIDEAQAGQHDLIVMPTRGSGVLGHLLHDHTARHVLNRTPAPVLVVP
jgi:nucleotide-binding universal stress UspA family protein